MIGSEPFARNVLVEDQYGERQERAETAEQRDRGKRINVGDRCCRRAREQPCNGSGHITLQSFGGSMGLKSLTRDRGFLHSCAVRVLMSAVWFPKSLREGAKVF